MKKSKLKKALDNLKEVTEDHRQMLYKMKSDVEWAEKNRGVNSIEYKKRLHYQAQSIGHMQAVASVVKYALTEIELLANEKNAYIIAYNIPDESYTKLAESSNWPDEMMKMAGELDRQDGLLSKFYKGFNEAVKMKADTILMVMDSNETSGIAKDWEDKLANQTSKVNEWYDVLLKGLQ